MNIEQILSNIKKPEPLRKRYSIYVLREVYEQLDELCKQRHIGISKLVEELMKEAAQSLEKDDAQSA